MLKMHGVISIDPEAYSQTKQQALLFDNLVLAWPPMIYALPPHILADVQFLQNKGVLVDAFDLPLPERKFQDLWLDIRTRTGWEVIRNRQELGLKEEDVKNYETMLNALGRVKACEHAIRSVSARINKVGLFNAVPVYRTKFMEFFAADYPDMVTTSQTVLSVTFEQLPLPNEGCAWEDILAFKGEMHDKLWGFSRFLRTLAAKSQTEAEIRDDFEWTLNEYRKAMEIHHLKARQSFVDVFLIAPLEVLEDLIKFRWSKIARGLLSVEKRKVELLEAEMKAPGRECAYIFDAQNKFGGSK